MVSKDEFDREIQNVVEQVVKYRLATDFIVYRPEEVAQRLELGDPFVKSIFEGGKVLYDAAA
jgi:hypothetical protein